MAAHEEGPQRYILSGCSGGGKSTLLDALGERGASTVPEPGREIVRQEQERGGDALPWANAHAFADRAIEMSVAAFDATSSHQGPVFFDRSFIDAISYLAHLTGGVSTEHADLIARKRYAQTVFLVPPWPEIFQSDPERQLGFDVAVEEYHRLIASYETFGYQPVILPKAPVAARADFVLNAINPN